MGFPIIVDDSTTTPSQMPTLADLRHALADQLGTYSTGVISNTIPGGEPGRWVTVDDFIDDEYERDQYAGAWVYAISGGSVGQQRRVRRTGYEGPSGMLALSRVFDINGTPTTPSIESQVEITHPLPVKKIGLIKGLNTIAQEALDRMWVEARIPLTGNGTRLYPLSNYPWITSQDQTNGIYDWCGQSSTTTPSSHTPWPYTVKTDGAVIVLETPVTYGTDVPFELAVFVSAGHLVYDGSAWGYSATGLVNDSDQAAVSVEHFVPVAMLKALQYLTRMVNDDKTLTKDEKAAKLSEITDRRRHWASAASTVIKDSMPKPHYAIAAAPVGSPRVGGSTHLYEGTALPVSVLP